jgi:predicted metal-dependent hydrolase
VQLNLFPPQAQAGCQEETWLRVGAQRVLLRLAANRRARRYVLRLCADGAARVTVPRGGSAAEARRFAQRNAAWLANQLLRRATRPVRPAVWMHGDAILFRGENVFLQVVPDGAGCRIRFADQGLQLKDVTSDVRPAVEEHLWRLAARELPARALELAVLHQFQVRRVAVRNQRSRWGSCSRLGTISLNWRLVQTPALVRDYIILHELAHLKQMNHSRRFWAEVQRICPEWREAERWLKKHGDLLR